MICSECKTTDIASKYCPFMLCSKCCECSRIGCKSLHCSSIGCDNDQISGHDEEHCASCNQLSEYGYCVKYKCSNATLTGLDWCHDHYYNATKCKLCNENTHLLSIHCDKHCVDPCCDSTHCHNDDCDVNDGHNNWSCKKHCTICKVHCRDSECDLPSCNCDCHNYGKRYHYWCKLHCTNCCDSD